jgi:hypothetical protein
VLPIWPLYSGSSVPVRVYAHTGDLPLIIMDITIDLDLSVLEFAGTTLHRSFEISEFYKGYNNGYYREASVTSKWLHVMTIHLRIVASMNETAVHVGAIKGYIGQMSTNAFAFVENVPMHALDWRGAPPDPVSGGQVLTKVFPT